MRMIRERESVLTKEREWEREWEREKVKGKSKEKRQKKSDIAFGKEGGKRKIKEMRGEKRKW